MIEFSHTNYLIVSVLLALFGFVIGYITGSFSKREENSKRYIFSKEMDYEVAKRIVNALR